MLHLKINLLFGLSEVPRHSVGLYILLIFLALGYSTKYSAEKE